MANILTTEEVRLNVETEIGDSALGILIDDADAEIVRRLGPLASQTEVLGAFDRTIYLKRKSTAITSAVERVRTGFGSYTDYTLASDDYELLADGMRVERLRSGTNPHSHWRGTVTIVYVPVDETAQRKRLLVDMVKLAVRYDATRSIGMGNSQVTHVDYQAEREQLFRGLSTQGRRLIS